MTDNIRDAIINRALLVFIYDGVVRTVEPHLLGYDGDGELTLLAWQSSGTGAGWLHFPVSKLGGVSMTDKTFAGPRPGYNPRDPGIPRVLCQL